MECNYHTDFHLTQALASEIESAYQSADDTFVIADLGCGKGLYHEDIKDTLDGLGDKQVEVIGFDINREPLEYTDQNDTAQADLVEAEIPLTDSSVDFIYSHHLRCQLDKEELENIQKEAERALTEDGRQYHVC